MRELRKVLQAMRQCNAEMEQAVNRLDHNRGAMIVAKRQEFAALCGDFLKALPCSVHSVRGADLFHQLQDEFEQMRAALASHQIVWSPQAIASRHQLYLERSRAIHARVEDFTQRSLIAIADTLNVTVA